jgi:hypothetical protein
VVAVRLDKAYAALASALAERTVGLPVFVNAMRALVRR